MNNEFNSLKIETLDTFFSQRKHMHVEIWSSGKKREIKYVEHGLQSLVHNS